MRASQSSSSISQPISQLTLFKLLEAATPNTLRLPNSPKGSCSLRSFYHRDQPHGLKVLKV